MSSSEFESSSHDEDKQQPTPPEADPVAQWWQHVQDIEEAFDEGHLEEEEFLALMDDAHLAFRAIYRSQTRFYRENYSEDKHF